jgi:hypothetical protein
VIARWWALVSFEVRQQLREPLTALYAIVFALLCVGFVSSGAVELVNQRQGAPKTSPWSLALAFGGLTAFGQVITTMVIATAFLRDRAVRTDALLATSGISVRLWASARLSAAVAVLCMVYAAMPLGALVGDAIAGMSHGADVRSVAGHALSLSGTLARTWLLITLPTCLVVAALLGVAAVLTQRTMGVLAVALTLVALWQLALGFEAHDGTRHIGALLDPFGNAPVLAMTRAWTTDERALRPIMLVGELLANRLVWLTIAISSILATAYFARWPHAIASAEPRAERFRVLPHRVDGPLASDPHASVLSPWSAWLPTRDRGRTPRQALTRFTATWMQRDGGWRIVAFLAAINAAVNAWSRSTATSTAADILGLVAEHSRLFLILLATVYAGEVLWRERDVRIDALYDTTPSTTRTMAIGRLAGLFRAQLRVVGAIALSAVVVLVGRALLRPSGADSAPTLVVMFPAWLVFALWLPFAQLTALSVAVHAIINHKVFAHLLLITGWVSAVVLDRNGATAWWVRFAESAPLVESGQVNWTTMALHASWWSAIGGVLLGVAVLRWPRGVHAS